MAQSVVRLVTVRIQPRADEGPALADKLHHSKRGTAPCLVGLAVDPPRDDERDDVEEANGGRVDGEVTEPYR